MNDLRDILKMVAAAMLFEIVRKAAEWITASDKKGK